MKKLILIIVLLVGLVIYSGCNKETDQVSTGYADVTLSIDSIPDVFSSGRVSDFAGWSNILGSDTFDIYINPSYSVSGTYNNLSDVRVRIAYGTYDVFLIPRNEPLMSDGFIYHAEAMNIVIDSKQVVINLKPSSNYGLLVADIDNIAQISIPMRQSQGHFYKYVKDSFNVDFTASDTGDVYNWTVTNVIPHTVYHVTVPVKGGGAVAVDFSGIYTVIEKKVF